MNDKEQILHNFDILKQELNAKTQDRNMGPPEFIYIEHDDYHAKHVGLTASGTQFFFPPIFVPHGDEFVVLFLFNETGDLIESKIENLGPRATCDMEHDRAIRAEWLAELEPVKYQGIQLKPFAIEHNDLMMGLIPSKYEGNWYVEVLPGNVMAFHQPWDSGVYDT